MSETDPALRRQLMMAKLWIGGAALFVLLLVAVYQLCSESVRKKNDPTVAAQYENSNSAKPSTILETAKTYVILDDPTYILLGKKMLKNIPKESKDYQEAMQIAAKLPSDSELESRIKKAKRQSMIASRRKEINDEWSKERIDLELAMHPERKERMARDYHAMYEAIKELYGTEEALRWDAEQRRKAR